MNEIRASTLRPNTHWSSIICSQLSGPFAVPEFTEHATGVISIQQHTFYYPDNVMLNMRYGLRGKGTTLQDTQNKRSISDSFYLLDFDMARDFSPSGPVLEVNSSIIQQFAKEYHKIIYQLFRWSVTPKYISMIAEETS